MVGIEGNDMAESTSTRRIVVGVDGSDDSLKALDWAAGQAELTGASVEIVSTWKMPSSYGWASMPIDYNPVADVKEKLRDIVENVRAAHPGVSFDETIAEGDAAPVLLERSRGAELLVVGTRGHGGFTGLLVGSVSMHCATHASCPVVVLRAQH